MIKKTWSIYTYDALTDRLRMVMPDLSKSYALLLVQRWKPRKKCCVIFAWPDYFKLPKRFGVIASKPTPTELEAVETVEAASTTRDGQWCLYLVDVQTGNVDRVIEGISKSYAALLVKKWKAHTTDMVLFAWPEWVPEFKMEIVGAPTS